MPRLVVDNRAVDVEADGTILGAARRLGIDVPTMCFREGLASAASCMVCVVKVKGRSGLVPSCATRAEEGMVIETDTEEVREARRVSVELLLADHLGDCEAPCHGICPAHLNIPLMIRQVAAGNWRDAIATVKRDIALPAVLGRICPAPCERGCRRAAHDEPVSIMLLKRYVADRDLASENPYLPPCEPPSGKRAAIVGAGPTGLAAAYYLVQKGVGCTVFDDHGKAGGMLRYGPPQNRLGPDVLDAEIAAVEKLGVAFRLGVRVGDDVSLGDLKRDFDALVLAAGELKEADAARLGLEPGTRSVPINKRTHETGSPGVFAGGGAVRKSRLAARAVADGKTIATSVHQYLSAITVTGRPRRFSVHIGRVCEEDMAEFMTGASDAPRVVPSGGPGGGLSDEQAREEALRCLHCDCRKADACKLRACGRRYEARATRYRAGERPLFKQDRSHPHLIYEPGKCIACGICVRISERAREPLGLTFLGRGFDARVGVPLGGSLAEGLTRVAAECVAACPTGALAFKETPHLCREASILHGPV